MIARLTGRDFDLLRLVDLERERSRSRAKGPPPLLVVVAVTAGEDEEGVGGAPVWEVNEAKGESELCNGRVAGGRER